MSERASTKGLERPILFSAPMVRALLDGRKTQTRRSLGQFDVFRLDDGTEAPVSCLQIKGDPLPRVTIGGVITLKTLKASVGDRLWVREAFADLTLDLGRWRERRNPETDLYERWQEPFIWYRADGPQPDVGDGVALTERWRPSIHMPRWASRLTLTVTDVRVQRLQDISEEDARAEGAPDFAAAFGADDIYPATGETNREISDRLTWCKRWYSHLWDDINGAGSWEANPWVAAYTFTVERRNIDEGLGQRADATSSNPLSEGRERS